MAEFKSMPGFRLLRTKSQYRAFHGYAEANDIGKEGIDRGFVGVELPVYAQHSDTGITQYEKPEKYEAAPRTIEQEVSEDIAERLTGEEVIAAILKEPYRLTHAGPAYFQNHLPQMYLLLEHHRLKHEAEGRKPIVALLAAQSSIHEACMWLKIAIPEYDPKGWE